MRAALARLLIEVGRAGRAQALAAIAANGRKRFHAYECLPYRFTHIEDVVLVDEQRWIIDTAAAIPIPLRETLEVVGRVKLFFQLGLNFNLCIAETSAAQVVCQAMCLRLRQDPSICPHESNNPRDVADVLTWRHDLFVFECEVAPGADIVFQEAGSVVLHLSHPLIRALRSAHKGEFSRPASDSVNNHKWSLSGVFALISRG